MFITLEGVEGAGKSTQARMLADALRARGRDVLLTREPGGTPGAETLRGLLLHGEHRWSPAAETYLHFAARAEHLDHAILPALEGGGVVVCDRFADSTLAYQGYGLGADRELIESLTALLPRRPDRTLMLFVDPDVGAERVKARDGAKDRYERMNAAFHARVAAGFAAIAASDPGRCRTVDASGAPDEVHERIMQSLPA